MPGKKVLIADDEIHIVQVVSIKLRNNGFDVLTAENGQLAYQLACDEEPDLIVTDYQMPEMSGIELIESIRKNPDIADTPIVMLTARGFAIDEQQKEELNSGILFIAYVLMVVIIRKQLNWNLKTTALALTASVLPFGPFVVDKKLLRQA